MNPKYPFAVTVSVDAKTYDYYKKHIPVGSKANFLRGCISQGVSRHRINTLAGRRESELLESPKEDPCQKD